ncbi:related to HMX1 ER localized, heme-binding peroxidase involved in the degradation of heme [Phialocephala subalpina]|uniref:Related to HMX1 ER localized, heme-binding peroxidase involved in the degradation of heme n=1 Tax=Phialocephala subalpina TaxID=576137 RepID=A0A1L7WX94_9HELO|nr:related to HMX1 ER localized, heme-binding peroxidase involved in the degradation of heme [Phialocephala subalpina]
MPSIFINPTPLLSGVEPPSLSDRINIATRSLHTQLNRLILLRLPLALPPTSTNPSKYISGLLYIAPIYITFESLWQSILDEPCEAEEAQQSLHKIWAAERPKLEPATSDPFFVRKPCSRTHCLLSDLQLPGLPRAERLRTDIRVLTSTSAYKVQEQLAEVSKHGKLAEFLAHTKKSVEANPHVLMAYAWVLYMALFSGGRHLRAELKKAGGIGPNFWDRKPSPVRPYSITQESSRRQNSRSSPTDPTSDDPMRKPRSRSRSESTASGMVPGMQFFNFIGDEDGEDIKREFKCRFAEAETHLLPTEKEDIVLEAQHLFSFMLSLISDLDTIMGTKDEDLLTERLLEKSRPVFASRDSVAVTHERLSRSREAEKEEHELSPQSGFLEVLVGQPAKLIQFRGWQLVTRPLGRRFSRDRPTGSVSFHPGLETKGRAFLMEHYLAMLVVLVSVCIAGGAWYFVS